jgi:hypothetical protein
MSDFASESSTGPQGPAVSVLPRDSSSQRFRYQTRPPGEEALDSLPRVVTVRSLLQSRSAGASCSSRRHSPRWWAA